MRPGAAVPEETWAGALFHAMKARLIANLLSQRAVPLHRTLRGHVSPKMPDAFWLSRSAVQADVLPSTAATDPGTWRHCLMRRITVHQLIALNASSAPADIWQTGTLHIVLRAPWSRGRACRMTFKPAAGGFGETLVLILDYAGPAITTFMTLSNTEASLRAPRPRSFGYHWPGERADLQELLAQNIILWLL